MPRNTMTAEDGRKALEEMKRFRKLMAEMSSNYTRRSGLRRSLDAVIDELDELAHVMTGNRDALLDPVHSTPGAGKASG